MTVRMRRRAARARCQECGSTKISAVCHHCAQPLCSEHRVTALDEQNVPVSQEFTEYGFEKVAAVHCRSCHHIVRGQSWKHLAIASGVAVAGVLSFALSVVLAVLLLIAAAGVGGYWYWDRTRRMESSTTFEPRVPLLPHVDSVEIVESIHGRLTLDGDGRYRVDAAPPCGRLGVTMALGQPDRRRVEIHRGKVAASAPTHDLSYHAGFIALRGPAGLTFAGDRWQKNVLAIRGSLSEHPFLRPEGPSGNGGWNLRFDYSPWIPDPGRNPIPIQLTPTLMHAQDQRTLDLELRWTDFGPDEAPLAVETIDLLRLYRPVEWGVVEHVTGRAVSGSAVTPDGRPAQVVEWRQVPLSEEDLARRRHVFTVRFENKINLADVLTGVVEVKFAGALSGLEGLGLYDPLGVRRAGHPQRTSSTTVAVDFTLALSSIRYQDVRIVPNQQRWPEDSARRERTDFDGVIPDYETVIALTTEMSEDGYYVKEVFENPPRDRGRANTTNRSWDVTGRRYNGVYPVDFHLSLTGEEVNDGEVRAHGGNTTVKLTVQGAFANSEMENRIGREWDRLHELVSDTLARRVLPGKRTRNAHSPPEPEPAEWPTEPAAPAAHGRDVAALRFKLMERLINGEITQDAYDRISRNLDEMDGAGR